MKRNPTRLLLWCLCVAWFLLPVSCSTITYKGYDDAGEPIPERTTHKDTTDTVADTPPCPKDDKGCLPCQVKKDCPQEYI